MDRFANFFNGYELEAYKLFGCHLNSDGLFFRIYAPMAYKIEVYLASNYHLMTKIDDRGIFECLINEFYNDEPYFYRIYKDEYTYKDKADPYGFCQNGAHSLVHFLDDSVFDDERYLNKSSRSYNEPLNIYELYLGSFKQYNNKEKTYLNIANDLLPYVKEMGYTHIELLPLFEYPYEGSWGYQATGFFAPTNRYGKPEDLMFFINECHRQNIGVILDVVYSHFASDYYGLVDFDYSHLYEDHTYSEWGTPCFNLNSGPVVSFLMSSAAFFLKYYHFDGLRFDAISRFIYHDGNSNKGENKAGISFLKRINYHLHELYPKRIFIAEDSSTYPGVTKAVRDGGLGFDYKWDLGWMNDTLNYYKLDPVYRKYHHNELTFSMAYFYSERFLLPFSHDEVVHSKLTVVDKMWGNYEQKFSQCRNLFTYMFTHPGKKLNFMGNDIASFREFDELKEIDWFLLKYPIHDSFKRFFRDLSRIYSYYKALSSTDYDVDSFKWIDADNNEQSIYSYYRFDDEYCLIMVFNMLPIAYEDYLIGVPFRGVYTEIINSERDIYNGCNMGNFKPLKTIKKVNHGQKRSLKIRIAPFAAIIFATKLNKTKLKEYHKNDKI